MRFFTVVSFAASLALGALSACQSSSPAPPKPTSTADAYDPEPAAIPAASGVQFGTAIAPRPVTDEGHGVAIFAGGCFWCMEPPFEKLDGVISVTSGYVGGTERRPTYRQVARGETGHTEAVRVVFDPAKVTYDALLDTFWRSHDPTDAGGQFADRGSQYRPGIFVLSDEQRAAAEHSKQALEASDRFERPIVVEITASGDFWPAEESHQDYYRKNPAHYERYARGSGRVGFLEERWGD